MTQTTGTAMFTAEQVATLEAARSVLLGIWHGYGTLRPKCLAMEAALRIDTLIELNEGRE